MTPRLLLPPVPEQSQEQLAPLRLSCCSAKHGREVYGHTEACHSVHTSTTLQASGSSSMVYQTQSRKPSALTGAIAAAAAGPASPVMLFRKT